MDHVSLLNQICRDLDLDAQIVFNCYDPKDSLDTCWPLKLPDVEFGPRSMVILNFQDFVHVEQGRVLELERVQEHYKDRSDRVVVLHWPRCLRGIYSGPVHLVEFSTHLYKECQAMIDNRHRWFMNVTQPKSLAWQCLNGRICDHRKRVAGLLRDWPGGVLSLGTEIPLSAWDYGTYRGTENIDNFLRLGDIYSKAAVNIITETQYDHPAGIITEKTFQALAAGQVPIIIGHAGIIDELAGLGYDVFRDLVDTSYDHLPDHQRLEQAILRNKSLILGDTDLGPYKQRLHDQILRVLDHPNQMAKHLVQGLEQVSRIIADKAI